MTPGAPESRPSNRSRLLDGAGTIVRHFREQREQGPPNAASEPWLYGGTVGTALLFAAFHRVVGEPGDREACLRALQPLRDRFGSLAERSDGNGQVLGIGGLIGIGSLVYTFLQTGHLLGEAALISEAHALTSLIAPETIAADGALDVMLGAAGALLALLALDREAPGPNARGSTPLELAGLCARHLLSRRISHEGRPRAWAAPGNLPRSGFAHGASGIALALLRLHERTGDPELREAALEGLAYERTLYDPEIGNWRDVPLPDRTLINAWCYGAPGIALARLRTLPWIDGPETRAEIDLALAAARRPLLTPADHLCCGNLGRAEILAYAARRLGDPELLRAALSLALGVLGRWQKNGRAGAPDPTFFKGAAGEAFALLHLAEPEALPFPLLLE